MAAPGLVGESLPPLLTRREVAPNEARRESVVGERPCEEAVEMMELDRGREARGAGTGSPLEER